MQRFDTESVLRHFDGIVDTYDRGKDRQQYYFGYLTNIFREHIPKGMVVLDVGCGTGTILDRLEPERGVGLDLSPGMIETARRKYPNREFRVEDISFPMRKERFDYVMLSDVIEHLPDLDAALEGLKSYGDADTLYVTTCLNPRWAPILHLAEALRLKLPEGDHEWISTSDLCSLLESHGFQVEHAEGRMLVPKRIPFLSAFVNRLTERRDWLRPICLIQIVTFRQKVGYSPA